MSRRLTSPDINPDLHRLEAEGYTVAFVGGKLVVRDVPYVDGNGAVHHDGCLVMPLELTGEKAQAPADHTASFGGGIPCKADGSDLNTIINGRGRNDLGGGVVIECTFSMKPDTHGGTYADFYEKVTKYVAAITGHATKVDPSATAKVGHPIPTGDDDPSPFRYRNTASSRAGIDALNAQLANERIGIVGLGGTGEYILDYVAKTEVATIDVFDGDELRSHNAFRAPGAVGLDELNAAPRKVDHFVAVYSKLRDGITAHPYPIIEDNVFELRDMTFVFIAIDEAEAKVPILDALGRFGIPYVDVGMGVEAIDGRLTGSLRTTIVTPEKSDHAAERIPVVDVAGPDDYRTNIQIAELNARNASDAVIAWKQYRRFYADLGTEHHSVYTIATNHIINGDLLLSPPDDDETCA
ncbi:MAG: ThiF family adenylyltransferase [Actinomycetota bacterium]